MINLLKATLLSIIISTLSAGAQGHVAKARFKKIAHEFDALNKDDRTKYLAHKNKAFKAQQNEKYFTSMNEIRDALVILPNDMDLLFLNGLCRAQIHDVDTAIEYYQKILEIDQTHTYTLMNMIEINYFVGRYEETIKYINQVNSILESRANGENLPLIDFKYLICLTTLSKQDPAKYKDELAKIKMKYTYMDDNRFYYFANALDCFDKEDKQEGLIWILKAYLIFKKLPLLKC